MRNLWAKTTYDAITAMIRNGFTFCTASKIVLISIGLHFMIVFISAAMPVSSFTLGPMGFVNPNVSEINPLVDKFFKWDAHWYTYIAQTGYDSKSIVFFPMTILLIKLLVPFFQYDYPEAGFFICNIFSIASFILLYALLRLDFTEELAGRALLLYAVLPTSLFLNSIYTEPLFLTFALAGIYNARKGNWLYSGIYIALAALTRNIGVFLLLFLLAEYWRQTGERDIRSIAAAPKLPFLCPVVAVSGFILYNYLLTGDPLAFVHAQKYWGREFSTPWENIRSSIRILSELPVSLATFSYLLDLIMVVGFFGGLLFLTFFRVGKIPYSYLLIGWIWFLIPLFSSASWLPLYSMSRFVLVVFPVYICLAGLPRFSYRVLVALCAAGLAFCTFLFTNWHWVG